LIGISKRQVMRLLTDRQGAFVPQITLALPHLLGDPS